MSTSYRYNQAGVPESMTSTGVLGSGTSFGWDAAGRLRTIQTGSHLSERSWHPNNVLAGAKTTANGTVVGEYRYLYDKSRNVTQQKVTGSAGGYTNDYTYTPAEQVKKWTYTATSGGGTSRTVDYEWDRNSNRTKVVESPSGGASSTTTTAYGQDNAITSTTTSAGTTSYSYDDAGRLRSDGCNTYSYDAFDRVEKQVLSNSTVCGTRSRTTTYAYDGLDRQRSMTVSNAADTAPGSGGAAANGTTRSIYDGTSTTVVGQLDAVNGAFSKPDLLYQLDPGGVAMAYRQTGAGAGTSFLDADGQSNVTAVVSSAQSVSQSVECGARFDPFGNAVDADTATGTNGVCRSGGAVGTTGNSYWYRGEVRDASTGNYQLGARTYDPTKAAFTTPDAYRVSSPSTDLGVGTDPLTANTYTYVNGNPLNSIDPDGHMTLQGDGGEVERAGDTAAAASQSSFTGVKPWAIKGSGGIKGVVKKGVTKAGATAVSTLASTIGKGRDLAYTLANLSQWTLDWIAHNPDALIDAAQGALEALAGAGIVYIAVQVAAACGATTVVATAAGPAAALPGACTAAAAGAAVAGGLIAADGLDNFADGISKMEGVPNPGLGGVPKAKAPKQKKPTESSKTTNSGNSLGEPGSSVSGNGGPKTSKPDATPQGRAFSNLDPTDPIRENGFQAINPSSLARTSGRFNYIVGTDGRLVIANRRYGHIDLANGGDVLAAGEFRVVNGEVRTINNGSGHYQPSGPSAQKAAEEAFGSSGLPVRPGAYSEIVP